MSRVKKLSLEELQYLLYINTEKGRLQFLGYFFFNWESGACTIIYTTSNWNIRKCRSYTIQYQYHTITLIYKDDQLTSFHEGPMLNLRKKTVKLLWCLVTVAIGSLLLNKSLTSSD